MTISISSKRIRAHAFLTTFLFVAAIVLSIFFFVYWEGTSLPPTRIINITGDIFCMVLGLVLFLCCGSNEQWDTANLKVFLMMVSACFISAFTDGASWLLDGKGEYRALNILVTTVFYSTTPVLAYLFWRYVVTFLNIAKEKTHKWNIFFLIIMLASVFSLIPNLFLGYYFDVDPTGTYHRHPLFSIPVIFSFFTLTMTLLLIVLARRKFKNGQLIVLFSYALIPMLSALVSILYYGISFSAPVIMMVFMLMYCLLNVEQSRSRTVAENELKVAAAIQEAVLPRTFPPYPSRKEFAIHASMQPAKEVGGDFYDFFLIDDDHLAMVIADVSGKGIPASLYMMVTKALIKTQTMASPDSTSAVFEKVNTLLCENNSLEMFVTAWIGILTIPTGELIYSNAGHEYPAIRRKDGKFELLKEKHSPPLAAMEDIPFRQGKMTLEKGDILYVYSDGVPEAENAEAQLLGTDKMLEILNCAGTEPSDIDQYVRERIEAFSGGTDQFDDITMLCFRYDGPQEDQKTSALTIDAEVKNLPEVKAFIDGKLEETGCPEEKKKEIDLAVEEIFVNIANYAYAPERGKATVKTELQMAPRRIHITFSDQGRKYDPLSRKDPDVSLPAEKREIGGLGVFLAKKSMDEITYEYKDGKNILHMMKDLEEVEE